jgi:hypothetical protein
MKKIIIIVSTLILVAAIAIPLALPAFASPSGGKINVVGTSSVSWEEAAKTAIETAAPSLRDITGAEVKKFDLTVADGKVTAYRAYLTIITNQDGQ